MTDWFDDDGLSDSKSKRSGMSLDPEKFCDFSLWNDQQAARERTVAFLEELSSLVDAVRMSLRRSPYRADKVMPAVARVYLKLLEWPDCDCIDSDEEHVLELQDRVRSKFSSFSHEAVKGHRRPNGWAVANCDGASSILWKEAERVGCYPLDW